MGILEEIRTRRVFFDGGTGSLLQARGLKPGEFPELWNISRPEIIKALHRAYLDAGADIISCNTFGINGFKFPGGEAGPSVTELVTAAVELAREAVKEAGHGYAALDMGPTGKLLKPFGTLDFETACNAYKEVVRAGELAGADLILIETMGDSYELKAAVLAAKEESRLPVFATVTLDEKGKMLTGGNVRAVTALLEGLGVDVIGLNCGLGPVQLLPFVKEMAAVSSTPILVNPNAGLPRSEGGAAVYDIDAEEFAFSMKEIARSGASVLGGCCGTTPEHIKKTRALCGGLPLPDIRDQGRTVVSSYSHAVEIGGRPVLIGERINPTGKPKFKQALKEHDLSYVVNVAVAQQESGADILDVNVGIPGIDEPAMMAEVVEELQAVIDLPLQIDTADVTAMERAMRLYNGKPLVNSVNGKQAVMDAVFPLIKRYGGVVAALCLDEDGIPETADGRMAIAEKIYETAARYGVARKDILIDALCMAVSADKNGALTTLETVRRVGKEFHGKTVLGVSNVSFGLPMREQINSAFFLMALQNGLSAAIINPNSEAMMTVYHSYLALSAQDENCMQYVSMYGEREAQKKKEQKKKESEPKAAEQSALGLKKSILRGMARQAADFAALALLEEEPLTLINREMIPALDEVGKGFEAGEIFLPQLLMSAEAAKAAFAVIKETMEQRGAPEEKRAKILLATVQGDIHDIGKNIVKVLLENYGFEVIDLGRDVPPEIVVARTVKDRIPVVGLSALMTTTVPAMKETIRELREKAPWVKIMVGGAVLTEEYAKAIGADAYGKDAMASVRFAMETVG